MSSTLSTKGKIVAETYVYDRVGIVSFAGAVNELLSTTDTGLQLEVISEQYGNSFLRLINLKDLDLSDIMKDIEIKYIILNPAPKTPSCKEFLEETTLMGPKEQFIDYDLTVYTPYEINNGKIHFKRKS